jgi:integrase/recombinase XerD
VLSEAQARRLMSAPSSYERFRVSPALGLRDRAILELLYGTGLRLGELLRLDLTDVDLARGTLLIRQGKGRKDRMVPVAGRAAVALDAYLAEARRELARNFREPSLFLSWRGQRMEEGRIECLLQRYAAAAKVPGRVHPHALRHACATHLLQGGASIRHVQALLGHASLATTVLYTKVAVKDLAQVLTKAHPSERAWQRRVKAAGRIRLG